MLQLLGQWFCGPRIVSAVQALFFNFSSAIDLRCLFSQHKQTSQRHSAVQAMADNIRGASWQTLMEQNFPFQKVAEDLKR